MDEQLAKFIKAKHGVALKVRDNEELIEETLDHLAERLSLKERHARNQVVDNRTDEEKERGMAESVEKFYSGTRRTD